MTVEEKAKKYADDVAFLVPYDGTMNFYDEKRLKTAEIDYLAGHNEAMQWRDPKEELPDNNIQVFVKFYSNLEDEYIYTTDHVILDNTGHRRFLRHGENVIGWRPTE